MKGGCPVADKELIPRKVQMPLALFLGILLLIVLVWRFGGRRGPSPAEGAPTPKEAEEAAVSVEDLSQLLGDLKMDGGSRGVFAHEAPPLERNPFLMGPEPAAPNPGEPAQAALGAQANGSENGGGESSPQVKEAAVKSRSERLSALRVSATGITRDSALALVNGMCLKKGDTIAGFVVKEINEREVILEDELGTESVRMPEISYR
jgi:hypothetical protein